jgi:hypothetical protein
MKESEKIALKEWAKERGMEAKELDEVQKFRKECKEYKILASIYAIGVVLAIIAIGLLTHQIDQAYLHCTEAVKAAPYEQVKNVCTQMIGLN